MLEVFDFPEIVINCTRRVHSITPLQSLALINSGFVMEQARYFAARVCQTAGAVVARAKDRNGVSVRIGETAKSDGSAILSRSPTRTS